MLVIASTFTANPIEQPLRWFLQNFSFQHIKEIKFAFYNHVLQELKNDGSLISNNVNGYNALLIKLDDLIRYQGKNNNRSIPQIANESDRIIGLIKLRAQTMPSASFIIMLCPDSKMSSVKITNLTENYVNIRHAIIERFSSELTAISNVHIITEHDINKLYAITEYHDEFADIEGHIPFTPEYFAILATILIRKIFSLQNINPLKAIILDCDNTLWRGVCGEAGPEGIIVTPAFRYLQQFVKNQKEAGVLLCLCSKNNEQDVFNVFNNSPAGTMALKLKDIAVHRINWNPKKHNIAELIRFLGFREESIVFIDDREDECHEIQKSFPRMFVLQLPDEDQIPIFLNHFWLFDHIKQATLEDKNRTTFYQQRAQIIYQTDSKSSDINNYLTNDDEDTIVNLEEITKVNINPNTTQRIADLTSRTNQFNCNKIKYSESQIIDLLKNSDKKIILAHVTDERGNNYGLTGLLMYSIIENTLEVDTFLLSCRIIGKNVEKNMLNRLVEIGKQHNVIEINILFTETDKNIPAKQFLESINDTKKISSPKSESTNTTNTTLYNLKINQDYKISYRTIAINKTLPNPEVNLTSTTLEQYNNILLKIAKNHGVLRNNLQVIPNQDITCTLIKLLARVSDQVNPGIEDDLETYGINSFQLMMFMSQIYKHFGVKFSFNDFKEFGNLKTIALKISQNSSPVSQKAPSIKQKAPQFLPLSAGQEGLWFEKTKIQDDCLYNLFRAFHLKGNFNLDNFNKVINFLINKHESLRTSISFGSDKLTPVRKISPLNSISFEIGLETINEQSEHNNVQNVLLSLAGKTFDLAIAPLLRIKCVKVTNEDYYLLIAMHHIICDGWSFSTFIHELNYLYNNYPNSISKEHIQNNQFSDFVNWQIQQTNLNIENDLKFWQTQLDNYKVLNLPYTTPRQPNISQNGQHLYFQLNPEITSKLYRLGYLHKTSLYETLLSIYMIFLAKICNQEDITLTSVIATRPQEFFDVVGYMVNLIILRKNLSDNPWYSNFLTEIKNYLISIRQHSDLPFVELAKQLHKQLGDITSLTRALFVFENFPEYKLSFEHIKIDELDLGNYLTLSLPQSTKFDLAFYFREEKINNNNAINYVVEFSTDVFTEKVIDNMARRFNALVENIVNNPDNQIFNYSALIADEVNILKFWNANTEANFPQNVTVLSLLLEQVSKTPDKIALIEEDGSNFTYQELNIRSDYYAQYLKTKGVTKGSIVAINMKRSIEMITALVGIIKTGGTYLCIDPSYPEKRVKYMCNDASIKFLIKEPLDIAQIDTKPNFPYPNLTPDDIFYIVYTSGSTGTPKGVPTTHLAFCNLLNWYTNYYHLDKTTNTILTSSEGFDAFGWQLWPYLTSGATIFIAKNQTLLNPDVFIDLINKSDISICFLPTAYTEMLIQTELINKIKTLQYLLTGGDKLNLFPAKQYPFKIINHYGVTECAVVSTFTEVLPLTDTKQYGQQISNSPPIGKPIANTQIYLLDKYDQPVPIGAPGELCIGGISVSSGYLNNPSLTKQKFIKNIFVESSKTPIYKTGDNARFLEDGNLEYFARLDNQIELRGYRIEPAEIEAALLEDPTIKQAAVLIHEDDTKKLVAYITLKDKNLKSIDTAPIQNQLKEKLPAVMIPQHIIVLGELPITENGKIDRKILSSKDLPAANTSKSVEPHNEIQKNLIEIFTNLLKKPVENINIDKSFFELGGNSIILMQLLNQIKKKFNVIISINKVYNSNQDIRSLAHFINEQIEEDAIMSQIRPSASFQTTMSTNSCVVSLSVGKTEITPLFFIHPVGGTVFCYQQLIDNLDKNQTCFGIQYPLDNQQMNLPTSLQELAISYVNPILATQPDGPYALVGHSFGGMLTYEIAHQLANAGKKVKLVAILDTWVVNSLEKQRKQKIKRAILEKYQEKYEAVFADDPMSETRFTHLQNIGFVYQPPKSSNKIALFKAQDQLAELGDIVDETNFWSPFTTVDVYSVPGDHDSMLEGDHVIHLAKKLQKLL